MIAGVARLFSRAAATYGGWTGLHERVASRLIGLAPEDDGTIESILELGCGTGVLTGLALARYRAAHLTAVDVARGMVRRVRDEYGSGGRVTAVVGDAGTFASRDRFDLLLSSATLHWALPLEETLANLRRLIAGHGVFVASLMLEGTLGELHCLRRTFPADSIPAGRLPSRPDVERTLAAAGFRAAVIEEETLRIGYVSAREFLRSLHEQGVTGGPVSRGARPLNRSELRRLTESYDRECRDPAGGVYASYRVLYFRAVAR